MPAFQIIFIFSYAVIPSSSLQGGSSFFRKMFYLIQKLDIHVWNEEEKWKSNLPTLHECQKKQSKLQYVINVVRAQSKIAFVDMNTCFEDKCDGSFWAIDNHFNTEAYTLYSLKLSENLQEIELGILP